MKTFREFIKDRKEINLLKDIAEREYKHPFYNKENWDKELEERDYIDINEAIIKTDFSIPNNIKVQYSENGAREFTADFLKLKIQAVFAPNIKSMGWVGRDRMIIVNFGIIKNDIELVTTVNHEIIHRIQLERSNNKENISRIKQRILDKGPNTSTKERWYINYGNYFELMTYAYTFAFTAISSNMELKQIVNTNTGNRDFEKLKKDKKFLRYLYDYYTKIKNGWELNE